MMILTNKISRFIKIILLVSHCTYHLVIDTTTTTTNRSSSSRNGSFNYLIHFAHGFVPKAHHLSTKVLPNDNNKYHKDIIISFAKPPPTSKFDLEAIEALEAELDYQERLERMKNDNIKDMSQQDMVTSHDDNNNGEEDDHHNWEYMSLSNSQNAESTKSFQVSPMLHNQRLDSILSDMIPELSRSQCGSLISEGMVSILTLQDQESGREPTVITRKSLKVGQGTMIQVRQGIEEVPTEILAQNLPLDILYEDEYMIVLNKAAGMVVHPAIGNWDGTVVNALAYYLANESPFGSGEFIGQDGKVKMDVTTSSRGNTIAIDGMNDNGDGETMVFRPGIVHRLDKGTTGILVVAKTKEALTSLSEAFASRQVRKTYVAVTVGNPGKRVVIDKPIGRHPIHRQRMRVVPNSPNSTSMNANASNMSQGRSAAQQMGRNALSFVDTLAFDGKLSLAQVRIETGRTHQIRVHLQDRTTPIYGDDVYGFGDWNQRLAKSHGIQRPLLHAFKLELNHPVLGKKMTFRAPMAEDMIKIVRGIWPDGDNERPDLFHASHVEMQ